MNAQQTRGAGTGIVVVPARYPSPFRIHSKRGRGTVLVQPLVLSFGEEGASGLVWVPPSLRFLKPAGLDSYQATAGRKRPSTTRWIAKTQKDKIAAWKRFRGCSTPTLPFVGR